MSGFKLRWLAILPALFLEGCVSHITYDYFEPSGAGIQLTNFSGTVDPNDIEYVEFEQGAEKFYFSCNEINLAATWAPKDENDLPEPCIGIIVESGTSNAEKLTEYLRRSISVVIEGHSYEPVRVRVLPDTWKQRYAFAADFFEKTSPEAEFELRFRLRSGEVQTVKFTRRHHSDWKMIPVQ